MDPTRSDEQVRVIAAPRQDARSPAAGESLPQRWPAGRAEVAALAAQLIADSGLDYQSAKRKAVRQVFGDARVSAAMLPDNEAIDQCLLEHLQLFDGDHDARVTRYRLAALHWMERLADFNVYLAGSVWKGIVAPHAPIHLQAFTDDAKELEIRLLNDGIHFDVSEIAHFAGRADVPALAFYWQQDLPILISVYRYDDLRGALKRSKGSDGSIRADRGSLAAVRELLNAGATGNGSADGNDGSNDR